MREFTPCLVDVGARWIVAQLSSAEAVLQNRPALEPMKRDSLEAKATGVLIFGEYKDEGAFNVKVRAYAPACGISEDRVWQRQRRHGSLHPSHGPDRVLRPGHPGQPGFAPGASRHYSP